MPRSIWNGTVCFGMVNLPVKLYSAIEQKNVRFHQVHLDDGARVEHRRFCSAEGVEVPYEDTVKGFELDSGTFVVLDRDEVRAAAGNLGKTIRIEEFVEVAEIDPAFFEKTYYVGPRGERDAYRLAHDALEKTGRAGIGRFSFHDREHLVALRPRADILSLHTMRFDDEIVTGEEIDPERPSKKPSRRESDMAERLIESLHDEFEPGAYENTYRKAVMDLIESRAEGRKPPRKKPKAREPVSDLESALESSLAGERS